MENGKDKSQSRDKDKARMASFSTRSERLAKLPKLPKKQLPRLSLEQRNRITAIAVTLLIIFVVGFGGGLLGARYYNDHTPIDSTTSAKQEYISDQSQLIAAIAKNVGQSVVSINVNTQVTSQDVFGFSQSQSEQDAGTGIIISSNGIILTNRHVVPTGTTSVSVTLANGTQYNNVQVIGRTAPDDSLDVAFLKIPNLNGQTLVPATLGDSSQVQVGDSVIAIGNALGQFQNTVTSGIISGYGREITAGDSSGGLDDTVTSSENLTDLLQTDAAINEGNSGGPLTNMSGQVIGLDTATASDAQDIGFAIPINDIKGLIDSVLKTGQLQQSYLGVTYVSITPDVASQYNLSVNQGAYIVSGGSGEAAVIAGSPAAKAGLQAGDVITQINNIAINSTTSLTAALAQFQPGDQVNLTVIRSGKTMNVSVTLGDAPTG